MMKIQGLIQAAGSGVRLGFGPKAFEELDQMTLLERAVHTLIPIVDSIIVAAPAGSLSHARAVLKGLYVRIVAGASSRSSTTRLLIEEAEAPWLLLHDVVHPFVDRAMIDRIVTKAIEVGAAAPGIPNTEFLYDTDGTLLYAPGDLLIGQKPIAFSREAVLAGYATLPSGGLDADPSLLETLERGGARTAFVPGDPINIKITTPGDLRLASALVASAASA